MKTRVAQYQADRTNQKLYFTRIYCQLAEQSEDKQLKEAHLESAIFHLYGGYLAFLQEIARHYHSSLTEPTLSSIEQALAAKTQVSPEVVRLQKLQAHDFLGEIERAWQRIIYKPAPKPEDDTVQIDNRRLPTVDVMAISTENKVSIDMVKQWRISLLEVIERLRESMSEF